MFTCVHVSLTKFSNSSFLQVIDFFREASEHGAEEHNLFVLPLHLILQLQDMFVCPLQKALREGHRRKRVSVCVVDDL